MNFKLFSLSIFFSFFVVFLIVGVNYSSALVPSYLEYGADDFSGDPSITDNWSGSYNAVEYYNNDEVRFKVKTFDANGDYAYFQLDNYSAMENVANPLWGGDFQLDVGGAVLNQGVYMALSPVAEGLAQGQFGLFFEFDTGDAGNYGIYMWYYNHSSASAVTDTQNLTSLIGAEDTFTLCYNGTHLWFNSSSQDLAFDLGGYDLTAGDTIDYRYINYRTKKQSAGGTVTYWYGHLDDLVYGELSTNSPPVVELIAPTNNGTSPWYNNTFHRTKFMFNFTDPDGDLMAITLYTSPDNITFYPNGQYSWLNDSYNYTLIRDYWDNPNYFVNDTTYWWYVECLDDYGNYGNSSIWNFTTSNLTNLPPHYELIFPSDGLVNVSNNYINLTLRVWDYDLGQFEPHPYTDFLNVTFFDNDTGDVIGYYTASNNTNAIVLWQNLNSTTLYHWYANVSDWYSINTTPVYTFYTGYVTPNGSAPYVYDIKPYNGQVLYYSESNYVEMGFTVFDPDSEYVDFYVYLFDDTWPYDEKRIRVGRLYNCDHGDGERFEWDDYGWDGSGYLLNDTYYWNIGVMDSEGNYARFPPHAGWNVDSYYNFTITYDPDGADDPGEDFPDWWDEITNSWIRWIVIACIVLISSGLAIWVLGSGFVSLAFVFFGLVICWGLNLLYQVELFIVLIGIVLLFILKLLVGGD